MLAAAMDEHQAAAASDARATEVLAAWMADPSGQRDRPRLWLILGLVFEQMTDEQRELTLTHLPPPPVEMWNGAGKAGFAAFIADVRGTPEAVTA